MAGSDSAGLRYGVIDTPEKYYLDLERRDTPIQETRLDSQIYLQCVNKERLLEN